MRYICKKTYSSEMSDFKARPGDVVNATYNESIFLEKITNDDFVFVSTSDLNEYFVQYDEVEHEPDIRSSLYSILSKEEYIGDGYDKDNLIKDIERVLSCHKEDIQLGPNTTTTLPGKNQ